MTDFPTAPTPMRPMSSVVPPAPEPGPRRVTVTVTFWLSLAAALTWLLQGIVTIFQMSTAMNIADAAAQRLHRVVTGAEIHTAVVVGVIVGEVFAALIIVALVFCAVFLRRGAGWSRILLTVVAAVTLVNATKLFGMIGAALLIACVILVWIPATNRWFSAVRQAKRAAALR